MYRNNDHLVTYYLRGMHTDVGCTGCANMVCIKRHATENVYEKYVCRLENASQGDNRERHTEGCACS